MAQLDFAQPDTALDVDMMILDFLTFQATNALFREYALRSRGAQIADYNSRIAENDLRLAHCMAISCGKSLVAELTGVAFSDLFLYNHADTAMPAIMSFRFNLMRSLELFTRRTSQINFAKVEALVKLFIECDDAGFIVCKPLRTLLRDSVAKVILAEQCHYLEAAQ